MEHHYRTYGSRYSNARSQAIDPVRTEPGLLSSSGSASDQQRHNAEQTYQQHLQVWEGAACGLTGLLLLGQALFPGPAEGGPQLHDGCCG